MKMQQYISKSAGFSIIEVLVSGALMIMALTWSIIMLREVGNARLRLAERKNITRSLDGLIENLRVATAYQGDAQQGIVNDLPQQFLLNTENAHVKIECTSTSSSEDSSRITFDCVAPSGMHITRMTILAGSVPIPGSVITPAPSDIIRLKVPTPASSAFN